MGERVEFRCIHRGRCNAICDAGLKGSWGMCDAYNCANCELRAECFGRDVLCPMPGKRRRLEW